MIERIFDLETDGLLDKVSLIHCANVTDVDTGVQRHYTDHDYPGKAGNIDDLIENLNEADVLWAHNGIGYDYPVLRKLRPDYKPKGLELDTMIFAKIAYPDLYLLDIKTAKKTGLRGFEYGRHSLKLWGMRLKLYKGDFDGGDWQTWTPEMSEYCDQDSAVTELLLAKCKKRMPEYLDCVLTECRVRDIVNQQTDEGYTFKEEEAQRLYSDLCVTREVSGRKASEMFGTWYAPAKATKPVRVPAKTLNYKDPMRADYTEGAPLTPIKLIEFNPGSRDHIAKVLLEQGWVPKEVTEGGAPKVDEEALEGLTFKGVEIFQEYLVINKVISMLAEGKQGWLKKVKDGRIHGRVDTQGAATGRMTHSQPNLAQVPGVKQDKEDNVLYGLEGKYGAECRKLFVPPEGMKQVGIDASGLELRMLANRMYQWDGGEYVDLVLNGDVHTKNQQAAGLPTRGAAKTFIYAMLYGAAGETLGKAFGGSARAGGLAKSRLMQGLPALNKLINLCKSHHNKGKWLPGLDGRKVPTKSEHSALNYLLQGDGAVVMKHALVFFQDALDAKGWLRGVDYAFMANVHDEWQLWCKPEIAKELGAIGVKAIVDAGVKLNMKCPLDGEAKIGESWYECH